VRNFGDGSNQDKSDNRNRNRLIIRDAPTPDLSDCDSPERMRPDNQRYEHDHQQDAMRFHVNAGAALLRERGRCRSASLPREEFTFQYFTYGREARTDRTLHRIKAFSR
jgi:hypothetical protein